MPRHAVHLQREIDKVMRMILSLGTEVEDSLNRAVEALIQRNPAVALKVMDRDAEIDQREVDVEEECLKILALYQPVANDLRLIIVILKINNDLERIGDLAVNIAERAVYLSTHEPLELPFDIKEMSQKVQDMLRKSLDALVSTDGELAKQVCEADDEVDEMNRVVFSRVEMAMKANPENINRLIQFLSASRYLERVADHATNIAEDVIYLVNGEIVRHSNKIKDSSLPKE